MSENKDNRDIFLQAIGEVRPLKKSNENFKKKILLTIKKPKKHKETKKSISPKKTIKTKNIEKTNYFESRLTTVEKKLKKGKILIDKKIDFHGLSIEEAKRRFINTIDACYYSNKRCILFITGKGIKNSDSETTNKKLFYGKIRENFKKWIYEKNVISRILNVVPAGFSHGGDGAFFVYLRKNKN